MHSVRPEPREIVSTGDIVVILSAAFRLEERNYNDSWDRKFLRRLSHLYSVEMAEFRTKVAATPLLPLCCFYLVLSVLNNGIVGFTLVMVSNRNHLRNDRRSIPPIVNARYNARYTV